MIGSDWPVCTLAGDYATVIGIVRDHIAAVPPRTDGHPRRNRAASTTSDVACQSAQSAA